MRLVTFRRNGVRGVGSLIADDVVSDLSADGAPYFHDMLALIHGGQDALDHAQTLTEQPKSTVQLGASGYVLRYPNRAKCATSCASKST